MSRRVNPNRIVVVGENSFIRLSTDGGTTISARCSHWRVLWTPAGAGHALFVDSGSNKPQIYGDNEAVVRYLQTRIESMLHKQFADTSLPVWRAAFHRQGCPPAECEERVEFDGGLIRLTWSDFMDPYNYSTEPGSDGRPLGLQTTFFPARHAIWTEGHNVPAGTPWNAPRDGRPSTSACLAWAETWLEPPQT